MSRRSVTIVLCGLMLLGVTALSAYATGPYPALDAQATARVATANGISTAAYLRADRQTATAQGGATSTPSATAIPATSTSIPATLPPTSTATATATAASTNTPVPPTATTPPTSTPTGTPTGVNTCHDVGDGAVDQNGISVDVWAPGKRTACGFAGYENGDNPMPAGTHLPAPRPFRFDSIVDHNEAVFGFKVFYRPGSEAPSGYQGTGGCGDVRVILHQGGSVSGFTTRFHTYQYALDQCDAQGNHHIIDVGGQIDTGCLDLRHNPDSQRCDGPDRLTADTISCDRVHNYICATIWYSFGTFALPGASSAGWTHFGMLVEDPITLFDVNSPTSVHLTGDPGTVRMLRDNQFYIPAHNQTCWSTFFNATTGVNEVVPSGTAGAWTNCADQWFSEVQRLEPSSGKDHFLNIPGIQYPN